MCDNFYQINNNSMSNNSSYNAIAESNDPLQNIVYPTKQDHIVSPESSKIASKEEIKALYFKRKSSSHCKSPDGSSQQNTRWTSKQFQDDFLSDDQSEDDNQEVRSKDSLFKKRLQESKKEQNDQLRNQYQSKYNKSLGLCDQDDEEQADKGNEDENDLSSLDAEEGLEDQNYESLSNKMKEIPTCKMIPCFQELDRQIKSLHELPSQMIQKQSFLLGEKIPHYFDNMNMEDGFDEIDEVEEYNNPDKDSVLNHRKKLQVNPIFHCNEIRLRFRVDSYNTGDENIYCQENDDIIVKNTEQLKKNHQQLKENKLKNKAQYHKSCINL